ncbi:hypothetical protein Q5741_02870 [Paenibacillus sp. JX-17]|uniref:Replication-associated protein G2P N-terminal domain-containing protein n=1 Tax=Paenibacillus lacisoli TaxID=3064525 RepID=A0ABT9C7W9_9BACL|nr:hypothetical protein [Paenibacillus sp. JX-17]MDO7905354.1 hypothetical protein [Paenibacillus sp. JX-17]
MVDMMYLVYRMTKKEYNSVFNSIQSYLKRYISMSQLRKDRYDKNAYITNAFSKYGFQEIRLRSASYGYCSIEVRLRPKLTIDKDGYYSVTKLSEFQEVQNVFNFVFKDILSLKVPDFFYWTAKRIEAAVDIRLPEQLIPKYLILFKRGYIPDYFLENDITKKYLSSQNNFYLKSENKTVNWYNRYETLLKKEKESGKKFNDFTLTKGLFRFETQVRDGNENVMDILNQQRLKNEVMKFYNLIVGKGDYHSFARAEQIISQSKHNSRNRQGLINMLKMIGHCGGVAKAKKCYVNGQNAKGYTNKFGKTIKKLRDLNINPVLIPEEWGVDFIENPFAKIEKVFE